MEVPLPLCSNSSTFVLYIWLFFYFYLFYAVCSFNLTTSTLLNSKYVNVKECFCWSHQQAPVCCDLLLSWQVINVSSWKLTTSRRHWIVLDFSLQPLDDHHNMILLEMPGGKCIGQYLNAAWHWTSFLLHFLMYLNYVCHWNTAKLLYTSTGSWHVLFLSPSSCLNLLNLVCCLLMPIKTSIIWHFLLLCLLVSLLVKFCFAEL